MLKCERQRRVCGGRDGPQNKCECFEIDFCARGTRKVETATIENALTELVQDVFFCSSEFFADPNQVYNCPDSNAVKNAADMYNDCAGWPRSRRNEKDNNLMHWFQKWDCVPTGFGAQAKGAPPPTHWRGEDEHRKHKRPDQSGSRWEPQPMGRGRMSRSRSQHRGQQGQSSSSSQQGPPAAHDWGRFS